MSNSSLAMILIIVLVSFLGFIVENISSILTKRTIDNRNMIFPFLLGYGLAILLIYLLFGTPNEPLFFGHEIPIKSNILSTLYYFAISFLCVSVGELILGHLIERTCEIKWWNYTNIPLHITRYTSIPTSAIFATLITVFMKFIFSPLLLLLSNMSPDILKAVALPLISLLSIDFINSGIYMFIHHQKLDLWQINLKRKH